MEGREKKNIVELTRVSCADYRRLPKLPLVLVADNVRSLHNVGSFFRTADAFLLEEIVLCGISGTPPHPELEKTALGADRSVAWRHEEDVVAAVGDLRARGYNICVLEQTHGSVFLPLFRPERGVRYALVCGNEVEGVSQRVVDMADTVLEIPQCGTKHSLNVAVSTGIALWHFFSHLSEACSPR